MRAHPTPKVVMAGLDPATQSTRVGAAERLFHHEDTKNTKMHKGLRAPSCSSSLRGEAGSLTRTDVRVLGGRVKPGHDDWRGGVIMSPLTRCIPYGTAR